MITTALAFITANRSRIAIYALVALGALATAAGVGYHKGVQRLWDYQVAQAKAAVAIVVKQGNVTERVVTKYITIRAKAQIVERTVEKEVIRYVDKNPGHCLDPEWGRLHDASTGALPDPTGGTDDPGRAPTAAEALETVTQNNARCIRTADRLTALQEWVSEQQKLTD
jgi:hypothetical protein